jgi:GT2 family glycosyltransferase/exopolysaccharide biosynthesis predicted pyruvyltransferase EpsI
VLALAWTSIPNEGGALPVSITNDAIGASRRAILDEIGAPPDLTLLGPPGNIGDQLIHTGTQALLADHIYREIDLEGLCDADGHTLLIRGGGAFCRPYHELIPRALAIAELRFERVIVLPSSFDPGEDVVRASLVRSRATVFARERESYRRIVSLCDARLAHDCAFFFDFEPYRADGSGVLNAFRTDAEVLLDRSGSHGNDDISVTAASLDEWLETIARHQLIRTDRAHVMIAGALLGKEVEFAPSSYHKVEGIASHSLAEFPVRRIPAPTPGEAMPAIAPVAPGQAPTRVTAVILTRDRPERALAAIESLRAQETPVQTFVIDNNSAPSAAAQLAAACAGRPGVRLRRSDRNLDCAAGRLLGSGLTKDEFVLFLDDDAELLPGALDLLVAELDAHPDTAAVTATVEYPDGTIHHSGGWFQVSGGVAEFTLIGFRESDAAVPPTGPAGWVPNTAALIRRALLDEFPLDPQTTASYYEDNEWSYRVELARPGSFRRSREARAVHHHTSRLIPGRDFRARSANLKLLVAHVGFYKRHGVLLGINLGGLVPELCDSSGTCDLAAARLLMELIDAKGSDWTLMEWMNGNLEVLLTGGERLAAARLESEARQRTIEEQAGRLEQQYDLLDQRARHMERQSHQLDEQAQQLARQAEQVSEQDAAIRWLITRHEALQQVEQGGWWRLRGRLLGVLEIWSRARKRLGI